MPRIYVPIQRKLITNHLPDAPHGVAGRIKLSRYENNFNFINVRLTSVRLAVCNRSTSSQKSNEECPITMDEKP